MMCQAHGMAWQLRITLRLAPVSAEGTTLFWAQQCNGRNWSLYLLIQLLSDTLTLSLQSTVVILSDNYHLSFSNAPAARVGSWLNGQHYITNDTPDWGNW